MKNELIKPQINADERRLIVFAIKCFSNVYSVDKLIISLQRAAIPTTTYEMGLPSRQGTRMKQIGRIYTDPCASAQSVFHRHSSAFICVHPRLIFNKEMRGVSTA